LDENLSNDIRYADYTTLSVIFKLRISTSALEADCAKWGMKVNPTKCKIIVNEFVLLGSVLPGTTDVKRQIGLVSSAFGRLKKKFKKDIPILLKMHLHYS